MITAGQLKPGTLIAGINSAGNQYAIEVISVDSQLVRYSYLFEKNRSTQGGIYGANIKSFISTDCSEEIITREQLTELLLKL